MPNEVYFIHYLKTIHQNTLKSQQLSCSETKITMHHLKFHRRYKQFLLGKSKIKVTSTAHIKEIPS